MRIKNLDKNRIGTLLRELVIKGTEWKIRRKLGWEKKGEIGRWELGEKVLGNGGMREGLWVRSEGKRDGVGTGGMKEGGGNLRG